MRHLLTLFLVLAACSGDMRGAVQSPAGQPLGAAAFHYENSGFGYGKVTATLPDGERFEGSYSQSKGTAFSTAHATVSGQWIGGAGTTTYSSNQYEAVLLGDRGHSMRCRFQGNGSGVGVCQVSDGRTVDVQW